MNVELCEGSYLSYCSSVLQRAMRDRPVPLPGKDRRLRLGPNPGDSHHRQAAETDQHSLRELHNKVGLE